MRKNAKTAAANASSTLANVAQTFGLATSTPVVRMIGPSGRVLREVRQPMYAYKGALVVQARNALWAVTGSEGADIAIVQRTSPVASLPADTDRKDKVAAVLALGAVRTLKADFAGNAPAPQPKAAPAPATRTKAQQPKAAEAGSLDLAGIVAAILANKTLAPEARVAAITALTA